MIMNAQDKNVSYYSTILRTPINSLSDLNISSDYKSLTFDYNDDAFGGNSGHVTAKCTRME